MLFKIAFFRSFFLILLTLFASITQAETDQDSATDALKPQKFTDQWEKPQALTETTEVLIFSQHKAGGQWVNQALNEQGIEALKSQRWLYVADISRMPGIITKLFALPKMKDYAYPIALVRDEDTPLSWPKKDKAVSVIVLDQLRVEQVQFFNDGQGLKDFLVALEASDASTKPLEPTP